MILTAIRRRAAEISMHQHRPDYDTRGVPWCDACRSRWPCLPFHAAYRRFVRLGRRL